MTRENAINLLNLPQGFNSTKDTELAQTRYKQKRVVIYAKYPKGNMRNHELSELDLAMVELEIAIPTDVYNAFEEQQKQWEEQQKQKPFPPPPRPKEPIITVIMRSLITGKTAFFQLLKGSGRGIFSFLKQIFQLLISFFVGIGKGLFTFLKQITIKIASFFVAIGNTFFHFFSKFAKTFISVFRRKKEAKSFIYGLEKENNIEEAKIEKEEVETNIDGEYEEKEQKIQQEKFVEPTEVITEPIPYKQIELPNEIYEIFSSDNQIKVVFHEVKTYTINKQAEDFFQIKIISSENKAFSVIMKRIN